MLKITLKYDLINCLAKCMYHCARKLIWYLIILYTYLHDH